MTGRGAAPPDGLRSFGRRSGHKLRHHRQHLVDDLLPRLRVPVGDETVDPAGLFDFAPADIWLEVGFGAGEHLLAQAEANPAIGFIGCEPFINGVAALLTGIEARGLANIRIIDDDARPLIARLAEASAGRVSVLFPDPWPKKRHHKRRLVEPAALALLAHVMKDGAELRFASDHAGYVTWALDHIRRQGDFEWLARRPADWSIRPRDSIATRYETKALAAGVKPAYLRFRRRVRKPSAA